MIKRLLSIFKQEPIYIYTLRFENKFYGLQGCDMYLKKININNPKVIYNFTGITVITKEKYEQLKKAPNACYMEIN